MQAEILVTGLDHPWSIASLPDGSFLLTEKLGRLRLMASDGSSGAAIEGLPFVDARGHGGLLDVADPPGFVANHLVFWTYAKPMPSGLTATASAQGVLSEEETRRRRSSISSSKSLRRSCR